ncbi:MAG TPA: polysaccharide biosynthesis/export family protein, partial [Methylophilaceae bacterium]|nr:polysaccharide biosynthesis/export family protein [Methylophilaceae bacterium]
MSRYKTSSLIMVLLAFSVFNAESKETQTRSKPRSDEQKIALQQQNAGTAQSASQSSTDTQLDYTLGSGDAIRILVFQNPDLTLDTRVSEGGTITYPLVGTVKVGGMPIAQAERTIAAALKSGGFVQQPQVNIVLMQ